MDRKRKRKGRKAKKKDSTKGSAKGSTKRIHEGDHEGNHDGIDEGPHYGFKPPWILYKGYARVSTDMLGYPTDTLEYPQIR